MMRPLGLALLLLAGGAALAQTVLRSDFDHDTTGFRLEGAHSIAQCGDCHRRGVFAGTPSSCDGCHTNGGRVRAGTQPATHILSSDHCESCHTEFAWAPVRRVDHLEVVGSCSGCHDNRIAQGKPANHIPTTAECDGCHRTSVFSLVSFSHAGIVAGCVQCHDGRSATGKPANHLPTTDLCEDCHATTRFSPVLSFSHGQALGVCSACHNGTLATGKPADHIPTTAECDSCHNTVSFN